MAREAGPSLTHPRYGIWQAQPPRYRTATGVECSHQTSRPGTVIRASFYDCGINGAELVMRKETSRIRQAVNIADLRRQAQARLPRVVFDYIDGGAESEITLQENVDAFRAIKFRPRSAVTTPNVDLTVTVMGQRLKLPFILAPVGSTRLFYPRGEEVSARAAQDSGIPYTLSTLSGTAMEDVRAATSGHAWYQVYLCGGRDGAARMIERAQAAGFTALVVTIDTAVAGMRERDIRNGAPQLSASGLARLPHLPQLLAKPTWLARFVADGGLMNFPNVRLPDGSPMPYADVGRALGESVVCWNDFQWIRRYWSGPIMVKGVHTAEDARQAVHVGATAIVVSNHGGRQLDGVAASVRTLPEIIDAVGDDVEVLVDGGIRRGGDIVKALCLGARAVLVGRAYVYGLAAGGYAGVTRAIEILHADIVRTMKLLGCDAISALGAHFVDIPYEWRSHSASDDIHDVPRKC